MTPVELSGGHRRACLCERGRHRGPVRVAIGRILLQRAGDDRRELRRYRRGQRGRRLLEMAHSDLDGDLSRERRRAGKHLVDHHADRVDVAGRSRGAPARVLGRHVARRSERRRRRAVRAALGKPRDSEVADPDAPVAGEQDVRRLDVAVHDALLVRASERPAEQLCDPRSLGRCQWPAPQALGEAVPVDQLSDVVEAVARVTDIEDLDDARIAHAREHLRLPLEALDPDGVIRPPRLDDLHRDRPLEPPVTAAIDTAERPLADQLVDLVAVVQHAAGEVRGAGHLRLQMMLGESVRGAAPLFRPIRPVRSRRSQPQRRVVMTKNDLAKAVAGKTGLSQTAATDALGAVLESIEAELAGGGEVTITGFGRFSVAQRSARQGVNPATGQRIYIAATQAPKFTAGSKLKSAVKS